MFFLSVPSPALLQLEHHLGEEAEKDCLPFRVLIEFHIAIWQVS